jgi:hypothetical protein
MLRSYSPIPEEPLSARIVDPSIDPDLARAAVEGIRNWRLPPRSIGGGRHGILFGPLSPSTLRFQQFTETRMRRVIAHLYAP